MWMDERKKKKEYVALVHNRIMIYIKNEDKSWFTTKSQSIHNHNHIYNNSSSSSNYIIYIYIYIYIKKYVP
jgi:hypothetical protein